MNFPDKRDVPRRSPVQPHELTLDAEIQFDCHAGVSCFNACCKHSDIHLTPYDIIRLKERLGMQSSAFVARYTVPFEMDQHGMPGLKLATAADSRKCVFLGEEGCTVYADRPVACRYYALGKMAMRRVGDAKVEDVYFVVKEAHCKGHDEPVRQTVRSYLDSQGVAEYDEANREWMDIVVRKRSAGPSIGAPSARSLQLFDMCSYDIDGFRKFIEGSGFTDIFDVPEGEMADILASDERLLAFAMRFLKQVLFGKETIPLKPGAREARAKARQAAWSKRRQAELEAHRKAP